MSLNIHLFASVNQSLLRRWNALFLLDLFLNLGDLGNGVSWMEFQIPALELPHNVDREEAYE